jgi:ABC-2 type transport system permease protein
MQTIKDLWQIAKKDLLEFSRDRIRLITFVIMPIFMMVLTGFIFPNQSSIKNIPIGVANQDSETGKKIVDAISNLEVNSGTRAFVIKNYDNLDAVKEAIRKQEINGGVVIPDDFEAKIAANAPSEVIIVQDQSNPQISAITTQTLSQVINGFSQGIEEQKISAILVNKVQVQPLNQSYLQSFINPVVIKMDGLFAENTNYFEFVAPGIMAMVVMTAVLTGLAASISREREIGTLDGILISPISRLAIILGKAVAQSIRGLIQGAIVMLLAVFLFGVKINGSILLVTLLLLLGIFSFVGLGILVSAAVAEQETATQLLFMFQFPMLFLSGAFFPIQQMPDVMQKIAHAIPLTYAIEALRKVIILGGGIPSVSTELIVLTSFGIVTLAIAVPVFRKLITR